MSFTAGRIPDRHARSIRSYLLPRCFGSNHVCRAQAALRDRLVRLRAFIDAVKPPLFHSLSDGDGADSSYDQQVSRNRRRFDEPSSIADCAKYGDREGAHNFKLEGERADPRRLDRSETRCCSKAGGCACCPEAQGVLGLAVRLKLIAGANARVCFSVEQRLLGRSLKSPTSALCRLSRRSPTQVAN